MQCATLDGRRIGHYRGDYKGGKMCSCVRRAGTVVGLLARLGGDVESGLDQDSGNTGCFNIKIPI